MTAVPTTATSRPTISSWAVVLVRSPLAARTSTESSSRAAELQRDGRVANVDLADAVGLSPSACLRRVKALEASGIIAEYRAEVSRTRAGLGLTAFIGLKVEGHSRETSLRVEQGLLAIPEVVACYVVSGADDFLVEAALPDLASYEQVLLDQILAIGPVTEARSTFVIRTVLSRGPLPLNHWR